MPTRLVLVGGGHAHLSTLEAFALERPEEIELTIVTPDPRQFHPAMLAGAIDGGRPLEETRIDIAALARRAGAKVRITLARGLDRTRRELQLGDGTTLRYDVASIAIGTGLEGADLPGVREHALMVQPAAEAGALGPALDGLVKRRAGRPIRLLVVGTGAIAIELALAIRVRVAGAAADASVNVTLVGESARLLPDRSPAAGRTAMRALSDAGIAAHFGAGVRSLEPGTLTLTNGDRLTADGVVWATGPAPLPFARATGLTTDPAGYLRVDPWLRSTDDPLVFAGGGAAVVGDAPVDPIRSGAILAHNLLCVCTGTGPLRRYTPRRLPEFVRLGPARALADWGSVVVSGGWVNALKERGERAYLARFRDK
ncbi:MAG: NAD(P)/FAD-dependent oxidoreductase [Gemmatimonadales bacterium]